MQHFSLFQHKKKKRDTLPLLKPEEQNNPKPQTPNPLLRCPNISIFNCAHPHTVKHRRRLTIRAHTRRCLPPTQPSLAPPCNPAVAISPCPTQFRHTHCSRTAPSHPGPLQPFPSSLPGSPVPAPESSRCPRPRPSLRSSAATSLQSDQGASKVCTVRPCRLWTPCPCWTQFTGSYPPPPVPTAPIPTAFPHHTINTLSST